jgi:ABC-type multidrug transport system fused ATPase/permease subunit
MISTFRKLRDLLDRREQRNALLLFSIIFLQGLVEAAGVASIVPFMAVLSNPQLIHSNPALAAIYNGLGFHDHIVFLIFLAIAALVIIFGRIGITALTSYATARYASRRGFTLSLRLLENYMSRPYSWFLTRHSADMGKAVLSEVEQVVRGSLMKAFDLAAASIVAFCLISAVVIAEPRVAVSATLLVGAVYALIYFSLGPHVKSLGRHRFLTNRQRFQIAQEMLSGIKEVKIRGLEYPYLRRFAEIASRLAHLQARLAVLSQMPRHLLEALAVAGIMTIVLLLLISAKGDFSKVLPVLALYAFAGLRLLPTIQNIYGNLISLRFGGAALDAIHADLVEMAPLPLVQKRIARRSLRLRHCLELGGVTFTYPKAERPSLLDVSLKIPARTTVGFVGSTGAGKTTLIDIIVGLLEAQRGELKVDGTLITSDTVRDWQQAIGYVSQHIFLVDDTVAANIAFGIPSQKIDMAAVERAARMAELHDFITQELPHGYSTKVGERGIRLSGGQRQRLAIARALYPDPDVLVFDEATSALDNLTEKAVMDAIRNLADQKTILIIAHRLSTVCACDKLFLLEQGRVRAHGTYDQLLSTDQKFREMALANA